MAQENKTITVALADDHILLRDALAGLINGFENCRVICTAANGRELIEKIRAGKSPDVAILDLNMPVLDGYETAAWLQKNRPACRVLMLTMYDSEIALIRLLQTGVRGFLKKDVHPSELQYAIRSVAETGFYYSHDAAGRLANLFRRNEDDSLPLQKALLSDNEVRFLKLACTEMTYKEIAGELQLNPRSVDNLRDNLFEKLEIRSRVGLAMYAIRHGLVSF